MVQVAVPDHVGAVACPEAASKAVADVVATANAAAARRGRRTS
jgi:hypothetical protein